MNIKSETINNSTTLALKKGNILLVAVDKWKNK